MAELMYKIANEPAPNIRFIRPDLPDRLTSIMHTALNKQVESRYQTGEQFASDLRALGVESAFQPGSAQVGPTLDVKSKPAVDFAATTAIPVQEISSEDERTVVMPRPDNVSGEDLRK